METSLQWSSTMLLSSNENQNASVSYQSVKCGLCIFHITIIIKKHYFFIFANLIKIQNMEAEQNCIETELNGFGLKIRLIGYTLKVTINSRESGKKYESDLKYQAQSDSFKFAFGEMEQAFQHIKDELTTKSGIIKINAEGKLQIGTKVKQKVRYLILEIKQVKLQQSEKLIQVTSFIKKDVQALKANVEAVKVNLDEKQAKMLKIKQQLRRQIADLKQQLLGVINLKSDAQATDGKIAYLKQQLIEKLFEIGNKRQLDVQIAQAKTQFQNLLLRESKNRQDKVKQAITMIQELKRQVKQLGKNSEVQLVRHNELEKYLKRNSEEQLRRFAQTREVQTVIKSRPQEQAQRLNLVEILLNYKFPKMMDSRFVPLTVDSNIGQFKAKYFKMINDRMFQKVDHNWRQAVSSQQLPRKGKYYFQVMFHYSSDIQSKFFDALVGIITQDLRQNQYSYDNKQSITYYLANGQIYENGSSKQVGITLYSRRGLVTVVIDADQRKISWYYDHQFQASTTISQAIMDKKIYACVEACYNGIILQFKS